MAESIKMPFGLRTLVGPRNHVFDNWLNVCIHDTTGVTTGCIVYTNIQPAVLCIQPVVKPVVQPGLTTGCIV